MMLTIIMRRGNPAKFAPTSRGPRGGLAGLGAVAALVVLTGCGPPGPAALHKGDRLVQDGKFEEAIPPLKEATQLLAHSAPAVQARAWNLLGLANQGSGQIGLALQSYQQALKLDRNLAVVDYNIGCLHLQQSNYPAAIVALTTYTTLRGRDPAGFLRLGEAHARFGLQCAARERAREFDAARQAYEASDKISPTSETANALGLVELQRRAGVPAPEAIRYAVRAFQTALARGTNYPPALLNLAIVDHQYLGDPKGALDRYHQYLALEPPPANAAEVEKVARQLEIETRIQIIPHAAPPPANPVPRVAAPPAPTNAAVQPRRPPATPPPVEIAARPNLPAPEKPAPGPSQKPFVPPPAETVTAPRPSPPAAAPPVTRPAPVAETKPPVPENVKPIYETNAGAPRSAPTEQTITLDAGAPQPAVVAPKKSLFDKMNPRNWIGTHKSAPETEAGDRSGEERYTYPIAVTPIPGNRATAQSLVEEGTAAQRQGRLDDAMAAYQKAMDTDSTYFQAPLSLGLAAIDAKDYATALTALDKALKLQAGSADARYAFAWVLQKRNYPQDAADELEKLVAQHPEQARAHLLLGNLYAQKLNQPRQAREHYLKVLSLDPKNSQAETIHNWLEKNP